MSARLQRAWLPDSRPISVRNGGIHRSGERNWSYYLWDVPAFQAWLEANLARLFQATVCRHRGLVFRLPSAPARRCGAAGWL